MLTLFCLRPQVMFILNFANKTLQGRLLEMDGLNLSHSLKIVKTHKTNIWNRSSAVQSKKPEIGSNKSSIPKSDCGYKDGRSSKEEPQHTARPGEVMRPGGDRTCNHCGKTNHFAMMRRSTDVNPRVVIRQKRTPRRVHAIDYVDYDASTGLAKTQPLDVSWPQ